MQLVLEKRAERSHAIALVSPLIAIGLTIVTMSILFAILGKNPISALNVYFIAPLTDGYSLQEIAVKAAPLVSPPRARHASAASIPTSSSF
jgi:simple sugar transport system permease protein